MGYYNRRNRSYGYGGGYDSTGRWRSEAWHMDGGANDEGYHNAYCSSCGRTTEHERGDCIPCTDRAIRRSSARKVREVRVAGSSGSHTVKIYPNGKKYCSCQGFKFRKDCKHVRAAV